MKEYSIVYNEENFKYDFSNSPSSPDVPPHFHNCYEILNFQKGDAVYMVEGKYYELSAGDILITNPREMHCPIFKSNHEYQRCIVFLKPSYLSEFITSTYNPFSALEKRKIGTRNKIDAKLVTEFKLNKKMGLMGSYYNSSIPEKEIMIKSHLLQFLVCINNIVSTEENISSNDKIDAIIQYINNNINRKISLENLSDKFYLNKYYISHLFKEKTGLTVLEYITHKRIMHSKELILEGMNLTEAAALMGFGDYSSFYRAFTKIIGIQPSKICK